ncbi:eukaryotic translation initiation factor [Tanacetum coccineum]
MGGRMSEEAIVTWIKKKTGIVVYNVTSVEHIRNCYRVLNAKELVVASILDDTFNFYQIPNVAKLFHIDSDGKRPALMQFRHYIMNKLTPEKFDLLKGQVIDSGITTAYILKGVISSIYDKASFEPTFFPMTRIDCYWMIHKGFKYPNVAKLFHIDSDGKHPALVLLKKDAEKVTHHVFKPKSYSCGLSKGSTSIGIPKVSSTSSRLKARGTFPYKMWAGEDCANMFDTQ